MQAEKIVQNLLLAVVLVACGQEHSESPEQEVLHSLQAIQSGAEARSLSAVMAYVSNDYQDHLGQSKKDLQRMVQLQFLRHQNIFIYSDVQALTINNNVATLELNAAMAARASDLGLDHAQLRANTYQFSVLMQRDDSRQKWRVISLSWRPGWR